MGVSRKYAAMLEVAVLTMWLAKDFSWVLLIPLLAWPAALLAMTLQSYSIAIDWKTSSDAFNVHALAGLLWILGNTIWMSSEFLWDSSSSYDKIARRSVIPWRPGPLAGVNDQAYNVGVGRAQAVFITALMMLVVSYFVVTFRGYRSSPSSATPLLNAQEASKQTASDAESLVWGIMTQEVYMMIYIGPWILKDLFWTCEMLYPALVCAIIVFSLMADAFRRFGSSLSLVEIAWATGNTVWLTAELGIKTPLLWPRLIAGGFLLLGAALTRKVYTEAMSDLGKLPWKGNAEKTAFISKPCSRGCS